MACRASEEALAEGSTSAIVGVDGGELLELRALPAQPHDLDVAEGGGLVEVDEALLEQLQHGEEPHHHLEALDEVAGELAERDRARVGQLLEERSEEHTSELQSLMRISYAVFCLKKKKQNTKTQLPQ